MAEQHSTSCALRTYTLTVKGEPFQVDAALAAHGLGGDHVADLGHEQVIRVAARAAFRAPDDLVPRLQAWFAEDIGQPAPFRPGTLLYWSPGDDAPMATYRRVSA